jgi:hypothetical protein
MGAQAAPAGAGAPPPMPEFGAGADQKAAITETLSLQQQLEESKIALIEDSYQRQQELLGIQLRYDLNAHRDNEKQKELISKTYAARMEALEKERQKNQRELNLETTQSILGNMVQLAEMFKNDSKTAFRFAKALAIGQAIVNTAVGITKALASTVPPFSYVLAGTIAALGGAQIGVIAGTQYKEAARGANFITDGRTNLVVGDNPNGRERVTVTPLSSPNYEGGGAPNINIDASINIGGSADQSTVKDIQNQREQQLVNLRSMILELIFTKQLHLQMV